MKRTFLPLSLLLAFFFLAACDDDIKKKNNDNNQNPVCGNGILETGETCDGTELAGATCENINQGFTGGTLACANDCTLDTSGCTTACQDACDLDNRVCDGDTLRVCETNAETGCTEWVDTDCTAASQTCMVIGGEAQCAACQDACVLDEERCNANGDGIEACIVGNLGCTEWSNAACPPATPDCEVQNGVPTCVNNCTNACTLDEVRCNANGDGIETCVTGATGCTEWSNAACPSATPACEVQNGVPTCVSACTNACTLGASRCNANSDGIETCVNNAQTGCTEWSNAACPSATPVCAILNGTATCTIENGSGESCTDAYVITVPFYTEGTDFTADFPTNDMTFTDTSCSPGWSVNGTDAVFAIDLLQDQAIIFAQGGGLDGVLYVQGVCDAAGTCHDVVDDEASNQTEAILFQAPADGTYYLIVKAYSASPTTRTYAIAVWAYEDPAEVSCDDGFDNDLDEEVDCADSDCFGVGPCTVENVCGDNADNDLDGFVDCADSDCAGVDPCGAENTADRCGDRIDNDNDGAIDCADSDCAGLGACGPENTEALCSDRIDNDGDTETDCEDSECATFLVCMPGQSCTLPIAITTLPYTISGTDFTADFTNNHNFTYSAGGCGTASGSEAVFSIDLAANQRIRIDETVSAFDAVIRILDTCTDVTPTCLVSSDSPETNLVFTAPADGTYYIVLEAYYATEPDGYNFTITPLYDNENGRCGDNFDNDNDGKIDCADSDCFGDAAFCTTETICGDGFDNDADGAIDCVDSDCASAVNCQGANSCSDALVITSFPFHVSGTDITADFPGNDHTFTGTGCSTANGAEAVFVVNLNAGQRIRMDETGTLDSVIRVISPCDNATTCLLNSDTPETNLVFTAPTDGMYYVILEAWSATPTSKAYDFTINLLPDFETGLCGNNTDDDGDGRTDCADSDCFGDGSFCTTETLCVDGEDNDDDGVTDCADLDCASASACELSEACGNPQVITSFPFNITGTNFGADFTNEHTFTGTGCSITGGAEAVFAVDLAAGERLRLNETDTLNAVLRVIAPCANATACLVNSDPEANILFTAPMAGRYFVVLESYYSTTTSAYNFTIEKFAATETSCTDTVDNDGDGAIDCLDSECLGNPACPTVLLMESFSTWPPAGWTIVDGGTHTGDTWMSSASMVAPKIRTLNGATGLFAVVDSDAAGSGKDQDERLNTPALDFTGYTNITLSFRHYYYSYSGQTGTVEVSTDGGTTWTTVQSYTSSTTNSVLASISLSAYAGQPSVIISFHFISSWGYYWLLDDVMVQAN